MSDDLLNRLKRDIPKTGFVTEMIVSSIFSKEGWNAIDHAYYLDKDESKGREIDVLAVLRKQAQTDKKQVDVTLVMAVEIKKSEKPWVIFTSPRAPLENIENLFDTNLIRMHGQEIWFKDLYSNHPIASCGRFGRVAYQAFMKGRSAAEQDSTKATQAPREDNLQIFGAFASCYKASNHISAFFREQQAPLRNEKQLKSYEVAINHGLLVFDGRLFEAQVRTREDVDLTEVHWLPYIFTYASKEYGNRRFLIDVVTAAYLPEYLKRYAAWVEDRAQFCLDEIT